MEKLHTTTRIRKALMAVGATLALGGIMSVASPVEAHASEWDERAVTEIQTDIDESGSLEYEIQWGDTLGNIAQAVGIPLSELANANGIGNIHYIIAGQTLVISEDESGQTQVEVQAVNEAPVEEVKAEPVQEVKAEPVAEVQPTPEPAPEPKQEVQQAQPVVESNNERAVFNQIVSEKGISQSDADKWEYIIQKESGFDSSATNPSSGAYGLAQSLPASKMASHGDIHSPRVQLEWMYDYMVDRYQSISGAYQHSVNTGWY